MAKITVTLELSTESAKDLRVLEAINSALNSHPGGSCTPAGENAAEAEAKLLAAKKAAEEKAKAEAEAAAKKAAEEKAKIEAADKARAAAEKAAEEAAKAEAAAKKAAEEAAKKAAEAAAETLEEETLEEETMEETDPEPPAQETPAKPASAPAGEKTYTIEEVRSALALKVADHRSEIKSKLTSLGSPNVTNLDPAKYSEFVKYLESLD